MNSQEILKSALGVTQMVLNSYLSDLSDSDFMKRPGVGCNHIAWQLGHLISSNSDILNSIDPDAAPQLPVGFAEKHSTQTNSSDDCSQFYTKEEYMKLLQQLDAALISSIDKSSDSEMDKPSPERFRSWCPRVGDIYVLLTTHSLMHAGQWVPIRRMLNKPVVI